MLIGPDLGSIRADTPFARIVLLHVNDISGDDQEAFRAIRDMKAVKYHVCPEGYMMRDPRRTRGSRCACRSRP